ncbi:MAG: RIP metalloprotease RseP [Alphaproteobacteria bacterium]|nr:RIP metalloprotease RseP [Alphaproteobacteria bacterium]
MSLISSLQPLLSFFLEYLLPFLVALTILVFIHELGHFIPARRNGIKVEVFSIGFGPELFGYTDKHGTRWKFSMLFLGGYIRMFGDADASSRPDSEGLAKMKSAEYNLTLQSKTVWQRMAVSFGGPLANLVFAVIAMFFLFAIKGNPVYTSKIQEVIKGGVAMEMGIKDYDKVTEFNGTKVATFKELKAAIDAFSGDEVKVTVERGGQPVILSLKKVDGFAKPFKLGVKPAAPDFEKKGILDSALMSVKTTYDLSAEMLSTLYGTITGKHSAGELGGVIAIGEMAGKSAETGGANFVWFLALLSINLGLLNLLPVPMLDGGHLLFYAIEAIAGKPVPLKIQEYIFLAGFVFVVSLMLMLTWNDLSRYKVIENVTHFITAPFKQ